MKRIKVGAAILNQTPLDWKGNRARIEAALQAARDDGVGLLVLPELCTSGYGCEDAFFGLGVVERSAEMVAAVAPLTRGLAACIGLPYAFRGGLYNTVCLLVDGQPVGLVGKQKLAGDGIHYEPRWFKPWPRGERIKVPFVDCQVPFGDIFFDVGGLRMAFEICEDAWAGDRRVRDMANLGIDVIANPSASHFAFGKHEVRKRIVLEGSRAFAATSVYANLLGNEAGRILYDGGALIAHNGALVARGPRLGFADWHLTSAVVDVEETRRQKAALVSVQPQVVEDPRCVPVAFSLPAAADSGPRNVATRGEPASWDAATGASKCEEFARAVSLALFDYLRKSRSRGWVISLSGGADSTAVAVLCRLAIDGAFEALGDEGMAAKLGVPVPGGGGADAWAHRLITCVYQATANSGVVTRRAAAAVAEAIAARYHEVDVEALVQGYVERAEHALGRALTWEDDDIALQNIQARVRAPGVWLLANVHGALLLSTSNRSEAAVGYATMDGDTSGGLAPVAGIDKAFLRVWLRWMQTEGPLGRAPIAALEAVTAQQPTAELRPPAATQTDEGDLMPYDVLDAIEGEAIRDKRPPKACWQRLQGLFPDHDHRQLAAWVARFFRLWARNQWKRERYAPSFHLDDKNLDPKTWCRFPILSGGFEPELTELENLVTGSQA